MGQRSGVDGLDGRAASLAGPLAGLGDDRSPHHVAAGSGSHLSMSDPTRPATPILISAHKIAIVGLGLIGGSVARRLVASNRFVTAWNHRVEPYEQARAAGIHCVASLAELVEGKPDVLVLAVPLEATDQVLAAIAPHLRPATTLVDVGSVKGPVRDSVRRAGLLDQYVGGHPMAGNERSGFAASDPALLDDALWALTFDQTTDYSRFLTVADMVGKGLGNRLIALDDQTHDRAAALISHMPHVVSTALANELVTGALADPAVALALAAGSWRDMTRVSLTDPAKTRAMVELDAANVADLLDSVAGRLSQQAQVLRAELTGQAEAFAASRAFFAAAQPFRDYKAAESAGRDGQDSRLRPIDPDRWREDLLASAKAGEQIVDFTAPHEVRVIQRLI